MEGELSVDRLKKLYGVGAGLLLGMGHVPGTGLNGRSDAVSTCLRASRMHTMGRGLGSDSTARTPPRSVAPPRCVMCNEHRWPAWQSKKGKRHCSACHKPREGRPACNVCGTLTWDGLGAPATHNRAWLCGACWCKDNDLGSIEWQAWFERRREEYPQAFADGGPVMVNLEKTKVLESDDEATTFVPCKKKTELKSDDEATSIVPFEQKTVLESDDEASPFREFCGSWRVFYPRNNGVMHYKISASGAVVVGKKKKNKTLQLVLAGSEDDLMGDSSYAGTCYLQHAHRQGTWEYMWVKRGELHLHHFGHEFEGSSPCGSPCFFGVGVGTQARAKASPVRDLVDVESDGDEVPGEFFHGTWRMWYPVDKREVTYHISKSGTVDVELDEVQTRKFVLAGSHADSRNDPKYNGTWFLESIHGVGTWEYMWRSGHQLHVHHFDSRCGADSVSPWGSPFFYSVGWATCA